MSTHPESERESSTSGTVASVAAPDAQQPALEPSTPGTAEAEEATHDEQTLVPADDRGQKVPARLAPLTKYVAVFLLLLTGLHWAIIALYVSPDHYLRDKTAGLRMFWTAQLFNQDWHLFAPDPVSTSTEIYARVRKGSGEETSFINLSEEAHKKFIRHQLIPSREGEHYVMALYDFYDARRKVMDSLPQNYGKSDKAFLSEALLRKADADAADRYWSATNKVRLSAISQMKAHYPDATNIQLKLITTHYPPISDPDNKELGRTDESVSTWLSADPQAPMLGESE